MKVLIAHADLRANGGAESYALAIKDRLLAAGHTVGLLDITGHTPPDAPYSDPALFRLGRMAGLRRFTLWKYALVCRILPRIAADYDYTVLSFGEGPEVSCPSLHIRHAPAVFSSHPDLLAVLGARKPTMQLRRLYAWVCRQVAGVNSAKTAQVRTVTNTQWTAKQALTHCNIANPVVLYPKVAPARHAQASVRREPYHMIAIGRIVPNKRLEDAIAVLDQLIAHGLPATLQIIGRADSAYATRFLHRCQNHPGLILNPNADRATLIQALAQARVGIHPYRSEHFGIAVAEMICAGVVPLVHNSGGVCELVENPELRFSDTADLADKAMRLMQLPVKDCEALSVRLQSTDALQQALNFDAHLDQIIKTELAA
jgi:glycosyltransferase involved in cell wall biosynthesis